MDSLLNRSLVELVGLVIEKTEVAHLKSFPCIVVKKTSQVTCRDQISVEWSRGSTSRCRVPKEVSGHGKGRVKLIPKADREIGKRVSQIVLRTSGKFI